VDRVANGLAHQVDRLKAIGNGQVPGVVARAWGLLA
jgi:DNA (cytosine-5)-methyltransferase 1